MELQFRPGIGFEDDVLLFAFCNQEGLLAAAELASSLAEGRQTAAFSEITSIQNPDGIQLVGSLASGDVGVKQIRDRVFEVFLTAEGWKGAAEKLRGFAERCSGCTWIEVDGAGGDVDWLASTTECW
jgi:hypothetical protein